MTKLDNVKLTLDDILIKNDSEWEWRPIDWKNDVTPLNETNMNTLSNCISELQKESSGVGYSILGALSSIMSSNAGWKSSDNLTGEVFNDYENNHAIGDYGHAEGSCTIAGIKGYSVRAVDQKNKIIYLTDDSSLSPVVSSKSRSVGGNHVEESFACEYKIGNMVVLLANYSEHSEAIITRVISIEGNKIGFDSNLQSDSCFPNAGVLSTSPSNPSNAVAFSFDAPTPENGNIVLGVGAHAEGKFSFAIGDFSHAECSSTALGENSHAEGYDTVSVGSNSHSEGEKTISEGSSSHAEGCESRSTGFAAHAEGISTVATAKASHSEGTGTQAASENQHVQGRYNIVDDNADFAHIIGNGSSSKKSNAHTVDWDGNGWFAGNVIGTVGGTEISLSGLNTSILREIEDRKNGDKELLGTNADNKDSLTIYGIRKYSDNLFNSLNSSKISFDDSVGRFYNKSNRSEIFNDYENNRALGIYSHAEGTHTMAVGEASHAEGSSTYAASSYQHVQGTYNVRDFNNEYAHIVGNGTATKLSNAHTVDWHGNGWFAGNLYLGGSAWNNGAYRIPIIYSGAEEPLDTLGEDGDIYIMYSTT